MIRGKKRIRSLKANMRHIPLDTNLIVGVKQDKFSESKFMEIGFSEDIELGECVLPNSLGSISDFNCNGRYDKHKNLPKETVYRHQIWNYKEWHGKDRVSKSKIVDIPYKRYPRTFVKPPSIELTISENKSGDRIIISPIMEYKEDNDEVKMLLIFF